MISSPEALFEQRKNNTGTPEQPNQLSPITELCREVRPLRFDEVGFSCLSGFLPLALWEVQFMLTYR